MLMYARTFVPRPRNHTARLVELAQIWATVASASSSASRQMATAASTISGNNDGKVADAFAQSGKGPQSAHGGLAVLSEAAQRTAAAHQSAAQATGQGLAAMDSVALRAEVEYHRALLTPIIGPYRAAMVIKRTREALLRLEAQTTNAVHTAYASLNLPEPLVDEGNRDEGYGTIPQELRDAWDSLTDEEKRRVLQNMADEIARANGMPPKPINWQSDANGHWDPNTATLHINPDTLDDPGVLHTVAHEAQHGLQFKMIDEYKNLSDADRAAIAAGTKPDPFTQYGSNLTEVQRLDKNWNDTGYNSYDGKGDAQSNSWRDYYYQPFEHDARRAGTEFVDGLTPEDLERYK